MTADDIVRANRSARYGGVVGARAIVPRLVWDSVAGGFARTVLDYGAGPRAAHTMRLRAAFPSASFTAHDFGANVIGGIHDPTALTRRYDIVFASNVLNVLPDEAEILVCLREMAACGDEVIVNFPDTPNYGPSYTPAAFRRLALQVFDDVSRIGLGSRLLRCWCCYAARAT